MQYFGAYFATIKSNHAYVNTGFKLYMAEVPENFIRVNLFAGLYILDCGASGLDRLAMSICC